MRARYAAVSSGARAMPRIAISFSSSFALQRLQSAGRSLRFARSPAAPKMTITAGPTGRANGFTRSRSGPTSTRTVSALIGWLLLPRRRSGRLDVPAELLAHRREHLLREALVLARAEA